MGVALKLNFTWLHVRVLTHLVGTHCAIIHCTWNWTDLKLRVALKIPTPRTPSPNKNKRLYSIYLELDIKQNLTNQAIANSDDLTIWRFPTAVSFTNHHQINCSWTSLINLLSKLYGLPLRFLADALISLYLQSIGQQSYVLVSYNIGNLHNGNNVKLWEWFHSCFSTESYSPLRNCRHQLWQVPELVIFCCQMTFFFNILSIDIISFLVQCLCWSSSAGTVEKNCFHSCSEE